MKNVKKAMVGLSLAVGLVVLGGLGSVNANAQEPTAEEVGFENTYGEVTGSVISFEEKEDNTTDIKAKLQDGTVITFNDWGLSNLEVGAEVNVNSVTTLDENDEEVIFYYITDERYYVVTADEETYEEYNNYQESDEYEYSEGEVVGTILSLERDDDGFVLIQAQLENDEVIEFTDWDSPNLAIGDETVIQYTNFTYADGEAYTHYYILDNSSNDEDLYASVESEQSTATIQSVQVVEDSEYNEKEFTLTLADGTETVAHFFASEEEFAELGLVEGAEVNVVFYNYFNYQGEFQAQEVYFTFSNDNEITEEEI